ncbi:disulfide bond formation protein B [Campylobacter sp. 19-13652]|uniref:disulfide bond formation protein B n=1 Tax=Campylobacter sp. 19-13652 TaxID=2840180 RepID=UPI001C786D58|nr:disulfide bond formation protein B [Campylobacter sp. 19-13652]BCX79548.1 disulfide bond formation protein B [Campylobacter sp. 19-13652]
MLNQKSFNFIMATAVFLVLALPVGIANFYLGYVVGEGPCTLCWQERIGMVVTGVAGILILRYGLKLRYIAAVFISGGYGMFMTLRHTSFMSSRDMGMGFGGDIFGAHTYTWGVLVYWVVIIFMGVLLLLVKKGDFKDEITSNDTKIKPLSAYSKFVIFLSFIVIASNAVQAFISAGPPPFVGKGSPERISLEKNTWILNVWPKLKKPLSFTGANVVETPYMAGVNEASAIKFDKNPQNGAFSELLATPKIINSKKLPFKATGIFDKGGASGLAYDALNNEFAVVNSDGGVYFIDENLNPTASAIIDMPNGRNLKLLADATFVNGTLIITGINKTLVAIKRASKEQVDTYKEWVTLRNTTGGLVLPWQQDRPYVLTVRAKKSYVATLASEPNNHYMYMLSVPNEKSKKQTLIKIDTNDRLLSAETPLNSAVPLKDGRDLGDYYITAAAFSGDMLYAYSKNYNTLMQINKDSAKVLKAYGMPDVGDVMSMEIVDEKLYLLSKNQSQDEIFILNMPE